MTSPEIEALIVRACDPRVGDRIVGPGSSHVTEVVGIIPVTPTDAVIRFTITGSNAEHTMILKQYEWMVRVAIEAGETFHAVEDDEE